MSSKKKQLSAFAMKKVIISNAELTKAKAKKKKKAKQKEKKESLSTPEVESLSIVISDEDSDGCMIVDKPTEEYLAERNTCSSKSKKRRKKKVKGGRNNQEEAEKGKKVTTGTEKVDTEKIEKKRRLCESESLDAKVDAKFVDFGETAIAEGTKSKGESMGDKIAGKNRKEKYDLQERSPNKKPKLAKKTGLSNVDEGSKADLRNEFIPHFTDRLFSSDAKSKESEMKTSKKRLAPQEGRDKLGSCDKLDEDSQTDNRRKEAADEWSETGGLESGHGIHCALMKLSGSVVEPESDHFSAGDTGKEGTEESGPVAVTVKASVILVAKHPSTFSLKGRVRVEAIVGSASILGYSLLPSNGCHDVFSPACNSLITVSTASSKTKIKKSIEKIANKVGPLGSSISKTLENILKTRSPFVVFRFSKVESGLCSFISRFSTFSNLFKVDSDKTSLNKQLLPLNVIIPRDSLDFPRISLTEELQRVIDLWRKTIEKDHTEMPVILVCGGKDSGKSTTNRMLINSSLNIMDSVYYLECDIGQTEFTPPGVVSLVKVTLPLLGPPFTHQRQTVCSYHYGSVTPKDNPDLYMNCVGLCVRAYRELAEPGPLVVNTMGWMKGLGWQLLLDTIRLVSPVIIVQLTANLNSQNIPPLTFGSLSDISWTDLSQTYKGPPVPRHTSSEPILLQISVPVAADYNFKMKSTDYRDLSILSHLGNDLEPGLTLYSATPYMVSWKDVAVHLCHVQVSGSQIMYALNASLVALCEGDISHAYEVGEEGPLFLRSDLPLKWIGYGIIRGIDMKNKKFCVITSLLEDQLSRVNVLSKGGVMGPEILLTSQKSDKIPYVDEVVDSIGLSAVRPRKHMPRRSLQGFKA